MGMSGWITKGVADEHVSESSGHNIGVRPKRTIGFRIFPDPALNHAHPSIKTASMSFRFEKFAGSPILKPNVVVDDAIYVYDGCADETIGVATASFPALTGHVMAFPTGAMTNTPTEKSGAR
jgi:hypothetical protein